MLPCFYPHLCREGRGCERGRGGEGLDGAWCCERTKKEVKVCEEGKKRERVGAELKAKTYKSKKWLGNGFENITLYHTRKAKYLVGRNDGGFRMRKEKGETLSFTRYSHDNYPAYSLLISSDDDRVYAALRLRLAYFNQVLLYALLKEQV